MASYMNVFVDGDLTLDKLVDMLKGILDIVHVKYDPKKEAPYELYEEHTLLLVSENTFFNIDGINFEDFHYEIDLRGFNIRDTTKEIAQSRQRAEYIFTHLKDTGKYRLMLTNDAQIKEEEFIPFQYQKPLSEYALKAQQLPEGISVYAMTNASMSDFVHELEQLLHTTAMQRTGSGNRIWYLLNDGKAQFDVMQTKMMGTYVIDVVGRVFISGERRYWQFESARSLYEQLKATGKYALQLKDNDGTLFEEFSPTLEAQ